MPLSKLFVSTEDGLAKLVDQDGNTICESFYDCSPAKLIQIICQAAEIEFDSGGMGRDVPGPSLVDKIQEACRWAEGPETLLEIGEYVGMTEEDFKV